MLSVFFFLQESNFVTFPRSNRYVFDISHFLFPSCSWYCTKGNEAVNLEKLAIVSTYESLLKLLLLGRLESFLHHLLMEYEGRLLCGNRSNNNNKKGI